jgi:formylglycine-generating enzyme required for sulfatase activity
VNPVLTIDPVEAGDAGNYDVVVSNDQGSVTSDPAALAVQSVILANPSFEFDYQSWTVSGNQGIRAALPYVASDGAKLVAFNVGNFPANGELSQSFPTTPGVNYLVSFDMGVLAYNTSEQRMQMELSGSPIFVSETFSMRGIGGGKVIWETKSLAFTADSATTMLTFRDRSPTSDALDLLLDNVRVTPGIARTLVVESSPDSGVSVTVSPPDTSGAGDGVTSFSRSYNNVPEVSLAAPATVNGYRFQKWLKNGVEIGTSPVVRVTMDLDYTVTAAYAVGPPVITVQPEDVATGLGGGATFQVTAEGVGPLFYQWRFNGADITGAEAATFTIAGVRAGDVGAYDVVVSNAAGSTTSDSAALTLVPTSLVNGSFESDYQGWTASGNQGVRITSPPYAASDGSKLVTFNAGNSAPNGILSQTFATTPGITYLLSFDMGVLAYNTNEQRLQVELSGSPAFLSETYSMRGIGGGKTVWSTKNITFTADSTATTVTFRDASAPVTVALDLLLDNVRLTVQPIVVTTLVDENDGTLGLGAGDSLREAIAVAGINPGADVIHFAAALDGGTITLGGTQLTVDTDVTIDASNLTAGITVSGNDVSRVFEITAGRTVSMAGLSVVGGGGWMLDGAGISNSGTLALSHVTVSDNTAFGAMGGPWGGGIYNVGILQVDSSTVSRNSAYSGGGGIYNSGTATLVNSTISGNQVVAPTGGGVESSGDLTLRHSTVSNNQISSFAASPGGGGVHASGIFVLENSIIAGNRSTHIETVPDDLVGSVTESLGVNLIGGDAMLAPLGNYGGPTETMPLLAGSPAIDGAIWLPTSPSTDQRKSARPAGAAPDIGAVEHSQLFVTTIADENDGALGLGTGDSLREAITAAAGMPGVELVCFASALNGGTITLGGTQLTVDADVMIDASNLPAGITVSGNAGSRVFAIMSGRRVFIAGLTLKGGFTLFENGAGIFNSGTLTLNHVTVSDNTAFGAMGAPWGGGIYNVGILQVDSSTVSRNSAYSAGGGIYNAGTATLVNSTISGNQVVAPTGGGVESNGNLTLRHSTVSDNQISSFAASPGGGGVHASGIFVVENSIIAGNRSTHIETVPDDLVGSVTESLGVNLIGGDPMLASLANYGGRTKTMPPLAGSPAIDAAIWLTTSPSIDQQGNPRPEDSPDIGAVEASSEFSVIPAGTFQMGDTFGEEYFTETPVHEVFVSGFYMAKHEVTKGLWDEVRTWGLINGYTDLQAGSSQAADHPVYFIDWHAMLKWCNARSEKEGLMPCYTVSGGVYRTGTSVPDCNWTANGYRLPTEAEWEKAARGGYSGRRFPWGDTITHSEANYHSESQFSYDVSPTRGDHPIYGRDTAPVGTFPANGYGLQEMSGNIWEWCWDRWSETYYASSPYADPHGSDTGSNRVVRSGGFFSNANGCRLAFRYGAIPAASDGYNGFRLARSSVP